MKKIIVVAIAAAFAVPASADFAVSGGSTGRVGYVNMGGDTATGQSSSFSQVTGNLWLNMAGNAKMANGWGGGFRCVTVATTAYGANVAFRQDAPADAFNGAGVYTRGSNATAPSNLPTYHSWDRFYAGNENWANNTQGNGYGSYGDTMGDNKGPFCNDEANVTLISPFGTFAVGNIMNPMRGLYDNYTVDPLYANQYAYYTIADLRANALRYGNAFGDVSLDVQINLSGSPIQPENKNFGNAIYAAVLNYEFNSATSIGAGLMSGDGGTPGNFYVNESVAVSMDMVYGLAGKTAIGPVGVAYTFLGGEKTGLYEELTQLKMMEHTLKVSYAPGNLLLVGILQFTNQEFFTPGAWGGNLYFRDAPNSPINNWKVDRQNYDFWAMYTVAGGVKPYGRVNYMSKKWKAEDGLMAGQDRKLSSTLIEAGVQVAF